MQLSIFDFENDFKKITKPIRLIELFAGYGSQHFALEYLGVPFESWKISEWAVKSIQAYKDAHFKDDNTDYSNGLTVDEVIDYLFNKGISANYNEPMKREQIKRMGETKIRQTYNNIQATHNLVSVCNVKAQDLEIVDTDKYEYLMTYSFPCQDLSLAGKGKGMGKGSGTRSGLLWEVERILKECEILPQILLMENVPEVKGAKNIDSFNDWLNCLESLGYHNYYEVLNAKDYGVPQNRERCFMISLLGDVYYEFPKRQKLNLEIKDILENNVDKKYYLTPKQINDIQGWNAYEKPLTHIYDNICGALTTRSGAYAAGMKLVRQPNNNIKLEIRHLVPKEFFRLMGVKDKDYENIAQNQSNASLYHLAGDSIVVNVLMEIFRKLF